jgi:two-component system response regulator
MDILLVEDVDSDAELAIRALKKVNAVGKMARVHDGNEALDAIFYSKSLIFRDPLSPKLIMLDIGLPNIDGLEVLRLLKARDHANRTQVIMLTGTEDEQLRRQSLELGAAAFLTKPLALNALEDAIRQSMRTLGLG